MNEEKFTGKADTYAKFRPTYPEEFINYLYSDVGLSMDSKIADIGAGTGRFSKLLLLKGSDVICVELNADMLNMAKQELTEFPNCRFVKGSAQNTTLDEKSIDFITVAQAFHWFDREVFKIECNRMLKNNGKVILLWNSRDKSEGLTIENAKINDTFCPTKFKGFEGVMEEEPENYADFFKDGNCDYQIFKTEAVLNEEGFIGRNLSTSYAPKKDSENYGEYVNELKKLFRKYSKDGYLAIQNITRSYVGKV